ncbi:sperm acrosome membrane-associated protein 4-like [Antechinus flavipes]|uniref:sperm acrosome membrane-associated protein 4-like n=1 Tax=Antechinus flavipes TaxID=38775 RepID=UPI0022369FBD|nr:sperm acrosome membrane-associated protein 4-like [Antechinus flavipes]
MSSFSLGLTVVLACMAMVVTKYCYFCDISNLGSCVSTTILCGEEEECYFGQGSASGLGHITNRGCVEGLYCGREQSITYMETTYSFITQCCEGNLCNDGPPGPKQVSPSLPIIIAGLSVTLLLA